MVDFTSVHNCRSSKDELTENLMLIHHGTHSIPKHRSILPFIHEARRFTHQQQGRLRSGSCSFRSISRSDVPRESSRMITLMSVIVAFTFAITLWYSYYHKVTLSNHLRPFQRSAPTMLALVNWGYI